MSSAQTTATTATNARIHVRPLERADAGAVVAMVSRCSAMTLYSRFHGVTDGVGYATGLFLDLAAHDSYVAWHGDDCVGLATIYVDSDSHGEIAVLVEDAWQRQGVGSALTLALVRRAREHGLRSLRAEVLADNAFILRKLTRIGMTDASPGSGTYAIRVAIGPHPISTPRSNQS